MKTFKIEDEDLVFDGQNNLLMVEEYGEEAQSLERTLTTSQGEWFLNILHGLDYSEIQGKDKTKEGIKLAITEAIYQDDRVKDIESIDVEIDGSNRSIKVDFKVKMKSGNTIEGSEVL